jgi:hypothetical protein
MVKLEQLAMTHLVAVSITALSQFQQQSALLMTQKIQKELLKTKLIYS